MTKPTILPAILSGGAGSRLWPLSRAAKPKQFQAITSARPMVVETLARVQAFDGADIAAPVIIASYGHGALARGALIVTSDTDGLVIVEPSGKNTAPAAALACHHAVAVAGADALVLLLPSDHHIGLPDAFARAVSDAVPIAASGRLVTFGITPTSAHTGYGYIKRGDPRGQGFDVASFAEKPPLADAETMLASGGYDWNAGIFLLHADTFLRELARAEPAMAARVARAWEARSSDGTTVRPGASEWAGLKGDSIDYAVMQKTALASMVPVAMDWDDIGSWAAIWTLAKKDTNGNAAPEGTALIGAHGNLVHAETGRQIALIGCEDMVVIDMADTVVVMPREKAQDMRLLVDWLRANGRGDLLL